MHLLWQDNVPSFLDTSNLDWTGAFTDPPAHGGAPWFASADGGFFSGQPVLWWDNGADSSIVHSVLGDAGRTDTPAIPAGDWIANGWQAFTGSSSPLDSGLLWTDTGGTTPSSPLSGGWNLGAGAGTASQWQLFFPGFTSPSETSFTEASHLLWTGGSGQPPPVTPPIADTSQPMHLTGVASPQGWTFPTLISQPLVWTEMVNGVATPLNNPTQAAAPVNPLFSRS
jgi:hypothetical protein